ncbi:phage tail protein [Shewanella dokdonensis]|uniref:Phage tail protein n=1 Tax=Shewanella dokdonensis TaxID=712036 RepID=A0ABX8DBP1_9GAMM|nr:phage tail protein [Shewanella dokdonensis]MCL1074826.1 phage tail protein [Shewanella dokdonensis]QVK22204.1 phage tail protein [Shewanella dokdonensis]
MNKPQQLRELLSQAVPHLRHHPEALHIFVENGNIIATAAKGNLSYEYQFNCIIVVTDYRAHADTLIVPILGWLATEQPELLSNPDKRANGFKFRAELINHTTCDIEITLALTERVKVSTQDGQLTAEHLPEPQFDEAGDYTLYVNQELTPWPPIA